MFGSACTETNQMKATSTPSLLNTNLHRSNTGVPFHAGVIGEGLKSTEKSSSYTKVIFNLFTNVYVVSHVYVVFIE